MPPVVEIAARRLLQSILLFAKLSFGAFPSPSLLLSSRLRLGTLTSSSSQPSVHFSGLLLP